MMGKKSQRYGFAGMILADTFVLLILFFYGLTYFVPPKEKGVTIRFGNSNFGKNVYKSQEIKKEEETKKKEPKKQPKKKEKVIKSIKKEEVLTQKTPSDIIKDSVSKAKKLSKQTIKENKRVKSVIDNFTKKENKPSKKTLSAVNNIIKSKGKGNDDLEGEKGNNTGVLDVDNYVGSGKSGNYRLGNRRALKKVKPLYNCSEEGVIVVNIWVNGMGNVIKAEAGAKGTTNPDPCLFKISEEAAKDTKWEAVDGDSAKIQEGQIIYNFKITE